MYIYLSSLQNSKTHCSTKLYIIPGVSIYIDETVGKLTMEVTVEGNHGDHGNHGNYGNHNKQYHHLLNTSKCFVA